MLLVVPPKEADQIRPAPAHRAAALTNGTTSATARPSAKAEPRPRDFAQSFAACLRHLMQSVSSESVAVALLEQFIVLRWLDEKNWLGNALLEQCLLHHEADPESHSFYTNFVLPRVRVLAAAELLSLPTPAATLNNETCQFVFDALLTPYRFVWSDRASDFNGEELPLNTVTLDSAFAQLARALAEPASGTRRATPSASAPPRVVRWMCRAALTQYLCAKLQESSQLPESELQDALAHFFALPAALEMSDAQLAELHNLFLRTEAQRMSRALLSCRVCDPASGSGDLLAAMLEEIAEALAKLDVELYGRAIAQQHNYEFRLKRKLINECLFAVDSNPAAVRLTRQRLWLALVAVEQSRPDAALNVTMREAATASGLSEHLACGDALLGCRAFDEDETTEAEAAFKWRKAFPEIFAQRGGFDLMLGNAPAHPMQGKEKHEKENWTQWCALFPQLKRAKQLAAAFFDLPRMIGAPQALAAQVVPRSLTLAEGWAATRAGLRLNYELLLAANAGEILDDTRFDQEVFLYRRSASLGSLNESSSETFNAPTTSETQTASVSEPTSASELVKVERPALVLPQHLSPVGSELFERLSRCRTLGEITAIKHGQRLQRRRTKANAQATVPLIGSANLRQFRLTDELPRQEPPAYLQRVLEELRQPKLVVTPTLQYLKKPFDTVILMAALDRQGAVALDPVNQVFPHGDSPFSLELLCALLNSSFARWYFYFVVFNRPLRAVECGATELSRLPLPHRPAPALVTQAERLTRKLLKADLERKYLLYGQLSEYDKLDEIVCDLYGFNEEERSEIWRMKSDK